MKAEEVVRLKELINYKTEFGKYNILPKFIKIHIIHIYTKHRNSYS
jgi:hypothetical protein